MFPPPSSSAYVCLRCHLRLARRNLHPLSTILPQPPRYSVSSPRSLHSSPPSQFTITRELVGSDQTQECRLQWAGQHGRPQGTAKFRNDKGGGQGKAKLREMRGDRGRRVREDAETVSVNALGKPTEVIVLRDTPLSAQDEAAEQKEEEEDERAVTSSCRKTLLETMAGEDIPMEQDTVNRQLDALRSQIGVPIAGRLIISQKEFFQLCKVIKKGYNSEQLDAYIFCSNILLSEQSLSQSQRATENLIPDKSPDLHFRPWTLKRIHNHAAWKSFKRAITILKKCWKVEIREEVERLGELVCTLPKSGIRLLSAGSELSTLRKSHPKGFNGIYRTIIPG